MTGQISSRNVVHDAIAQAGRPVGFEKMGSSWYAYRPESILVLDPQKSNYGDKFFINAGIYWRSLGPLKTPREEQCHVRGRTSSFLPEDVSEAVEEALDFESGSSNHPIRESIVARALSDYVIPSMEKCSMLEGLRSEYIAGGLRRALVARKLIEEMGIC